MAKRLNILVVEDHADTRDVLVKVLTMLGHCAESCSDVKTAILRLKREGLDVLLTNVYLADAVSLDYLADLTKQGRLPPRVISMSAGDDFEERRRSGSAGCADHLVKSFTVASLEAVLR